MSNFRDIKRGTLVGFRLGEPLGQGGMAAVYRATDLGTGEDVAFKVVGVSVDTTESSSDNHDIWGRFRVEVEGTRRLRHPRIPRLYTHGALAIDETWYPYLVMQLIRGAHSMTKAWEQMGKNREWLLDRAAEVLETLQYVHQQGIIHRDLKPENILLDENGELFITDFGLARVIMSGEDRMTRTNQVMGTFHYMAVEQMGSAKYVDERADLFSLGVIVLELLENITDWDSLMPKLLGNDPIEFKSPMSPPLQAWLRKMIATDRDERYTSASTALEALNNVRTSLPSAPRPPSPKPAPKPAPTAVRAAPDWQRFLQPALYVGILLAGAVLGYFLHP